MLFIILIALAGGGVFAAAQGVFGAIAKADVAKVKADVEAELKKAEASVSAEIKKLVADVRAKL
jgi:ribosomal protein S9